MRIVALTLLLCTVISYSYQGNASGKLEILYEWKTLKIDISDLSQSFVKYIISDLYNVKNMIATSIKRYKNKIFLAIPRIKPAVLITMAWIPAEPVDGNKSPLLNPYPSWNANFLSDDCNSTIKSVHGFEIDKYGIMWVLDSGRITTSLKFENIKDCPPSLIFIDLNKTVPDIKSRIVIPDVVASPLSYLNDIVIDDYDGGYAYITDSSPDPGIIVYERKRNKFWKFTHHKSMDIDPNAINVKMGNVEFEIKYRINGIALSPQYFSHSNKLIRNVYYAPVSSRSIYVISTAALRSEDIGDSLLLNGRGNDYYKKYVGTIGKKSAQSVGMISDENGILYYGMIGEQKVNSWNWDFAFEDEKVHEMERILNGQEFLKNDNFEWIERFAIDDDGNLFILSNNFHRSSTDSVDEEVVNFRIFKTNIGARSYLHSKNLSHLEHSIQS